MNASHPPPQIASNCDGRGRHHSPTPLCMFLFLFKPRLPCDLFRKKKMCWGGGGVGAGGRSEGGGVATFFLFTRISTPDPPRPPPRPVVWLQQRVQVALQASGWRAPCWAALLPAPRACTPHGLWGAPSPPCPQGRAQAAAAPVQVPSGLLTLHTLTHIPRPSTLTHTFCSHPAPFAPQTGAAPPATFKKKKKQAYT